jgi:nucleoside-diphosphate-sugar epimerase
MKIFVTGGAGYIGSVLVPKLLMSGYDVTVLDNFMFGQNSLTDACKFENFHVVNGDTRDRVQVKRLMKDADVIIPLAALVGAPICKKDPLATESINQHAVEMICELASTNQRILMPVSNSGYGIGEAGAFCTEDSPLNPLSLYGITKVKAEEAVLARENSITFRLATVFGMSSRMRIDLLVNDFVYRAINDSAVVIFEGHFKRNYIHIQDVVSAFLYGVENFDKMKGLPYNVGLDNANLSKIELAETIKKQIPSFVYLEAPIGEDPDKRNYIVSNARLAKAGFIPQWSLERGITELIKGYTIIGNSKYGNI